MIGVSKDSVASQKKFADKLDLSFPLLADSGGRVIESYGVAGLLGFSKRKTFLIDSKGKIAKVYGSVSPEEHAGEVARDLASVP